MVVEAKVALQRAFELAELREVAPPELDPPVLVEDRALEALHEAVGEGMTGLRPGAHDNIELMKTIMGTTSATMRTLGCGT